jgi:hypothetical protein
VFTGSKLYVYIPLLFVSTEITRPLNPLTILGIELPMISFCNLVALEKSLSPTYPAERLSIA